jgi:tape measure domain-containing protein
MSSIKTAIELNDRMSSVLRQISSNIENTTSKMSRMNRETNESVSLAGKLAGAISGVVAGYSLLEGVGAITKLSDQMSNTTARLNMMNDGLQTTEQLQNMIFASAQRMRGSYADTANTVAQLALRAPDAFGSNKEAILFAENLGKLFTIAGAEQQEMASATLQLTQALGSGVLRGEELNAVFEAAPNVIQKIADEMGVTIGEIRDLASNGEVSADVVKKSLLNATDEINEQFEKMPRTFAQSMQSVKNTALMAFQPILKLTSQIASSEKMSNVMDNLGNSLAKVASIATVAFDVIASIGGFIYDNWWAIGPVLGTVTSAVLVLTGAFVAMKTWTLAVAAATWVMNAALYASPFTWVLLAVVAIVGAFYLAVNIINHFAGTSINATAVVAATFAGLFAFLYNNFAGLANTIMYVAEFLANVFRNPIYSVKMLFVNMISNVIDMLSALISGFDGAATALANAFVSGANIAIKAINGVISALNLIPGIDIGTVGSVSKISSVSSNLGNAKSKLQQWAGDKPSDYWTAPTMKMKDVVGTATSAYNKTANFTAKDFVGNLNGAVGSQLQDLIDGIGDVAGNTADGAKSGKDTAKSAKKAADKAGILVDDLKYMRDLSEREAINRYTTASINVDMKNNMNINDSMDVDGIVHQLAVGLDEVAQTLASGGNIDV